MKGGKRYNMRNKYSYICCGIIIALFCLSNNISYAHETTEKQYIVEFVDDIALFDLRQKDTTINVLSELELQECIDAGIVEWYEEDYEVELLDVECFENEQTQVKTQNEIVKWDLSLINAFKAKELLCEGQEVNIGIIDSGIMKHPDLQDNIKQGFNYFNSTTDVTDNIGHGTFVGGLIAAKNNQMGVVGIAAETNLIPLKCFDSNEKTTVSTICLAIKDAVDVYDCDIINMSLGLTSYSQKLEEYIQYATDAGVFVVAAVGNKGTDVLYYPAAFEKVIGVGSVNSDYEISSFSQHNSSVDFVAPGEDVWSTSNDGSYSKKSGTSFSTPLVSGLIAIMLNIDSKITYDEVVTLLADTATICDGWSNDSGAFERDDYYGHGLVNVSDCLTNMLKEHTFFISPLDFEENETHVSIVNNSNTEFIGYCMWGEYTVRGMMNMDWEYVVIPPGGFVIADTNITSNKIKCFLWQSISDISVISDFREREAN